MIWSGLSGVEGPGKERPVSNSKGVKPEILLTEERTDINTNGRADNHVNLVCAQILANFIFNVRFIRSTLLKIPGVKIKPCGNLL